MKSSFELIYHDYTTAGWLAIMSLLDEKYLFHVIHTKLKLSAITQCTDDTIVDNITRQFDQCWRTSSIATAPLTVINSLLCYSDISWKHFSCECECERERCWKSVCVHLIDFHMRVIIMTFQ